MYGYSTLNKITDYQYMDIRRSSRPFRRKELLSLLISQYVVVKTSKKIMTQIKELKFSLVISKKGFRMSILSHPKTTEILIHVLTSL
jgi:hypothetical protein